MGALDLGACRLRISLVARALAGIGSTRFKLYLSDYSGRPRPSSWEEMNRPPSTPYALPSSIILQRESVSVRS